MSRSTRRIAAGIAAAVATGLVLVGAPSAQAVDYTPKLLTAEEAQAAVNWPTPLNIVQLPAMGTMAYRSFSEGEAPLGRFAVSIMEWAKPKPMSKEELKKYASQSSPANSDPTMQCRIYENKPPKFTQVCWGDGIVFGTSSEQATGKKKKKVFVMGQTTELVENPDPESDEPGTITEAMKDAAAAQAKALRDAQKKKALG